MTTNHKGMTQAVIAKNRARRLSIKLCPPALSHRHMTMTLCHKATAQRRMSASGCNAPARSEMGTNETHTSAKAKWVLSETRCLRIKDTLVRGESVSMGICPGTPDERRLSRDSLTAGPRNAQASRIHRDKRRRRCGRRRARKCLRR